jgi:hypothetical protein
MRQSRHTATLLAPMIMVDAGAGRRLARRGAFDD